MQRLFKNERIPHGWMAVSRYEEIEADFKKYYEEVRRLRGTAASSVSGGNQWWPAGIRCVFAPRCATSISTLMRLQGSTSLRTAILINCGAAEDVRELLHLESRTNVRVIIVDSHRCGPAPCTAALKACFAGCPLMVAPACHRLRMKPAPRA